MMTLDVKQVSRPARRIGRLDGDDVYETFLKGGLVVIEAAGKGGKRKTLGVGPHRALARHVAKMQEPGLMLTELSKSEVLPSEYWAQDIGAAVALVKRFQARE